MRTLMILGATLLMFGLILGCGQPVEEPGEETLSSEAQDLETYACTASNPCQYPYNGVAVSCSGTTSCTMTSNGVNCDGKKRYCAYPPPTTCASNPAMTCSNNATCEAICGGPGYGVCLTSTACCVCL